MNQRCARGFTMVELLVVVAILAVLMGLLLPTVIRARHSAAFVACKSNLAQIANATRMYANDNRDRYPDTYTAGGAFFRRGAGERDPLDPTSLPETFGLPALYGQFGYLPKITDVWICRSRPELMQSYRNTYIWALLTTTSSVPTANVGNWTSQQRSRPKNRDTFWVYENFANMPYKPGLRRGTGDPNPTFPTALRQPYPHPYKTRSARAMNVLYIDGSVGAEVYFTNPTHTEAYHGE